MGSPNPNWCIWVAYRPIIPRNSQRSTFWGTSFCWILAILAPQKQAAARPNFSALGGVPGDFLALSNPYWYIWVPYRSIVPKKLQKSTFLGTSFCPILAILAPKMGRLGHLVRPGSKFLASWGSPHMAPSPNNRKFEIQNLLPSRWYLSCETLC